MKEKGFWDYFSNKETGTALFVGFLLGIITMWLILKPEIVHMVRLIDNTNAKMDVVLSCTLDAKSEQCTDDLLKLSDTRDAYDNRYKNKNLSRGL